MLKLLFAYTLASIIAVSMTVQLKQPNMTRNIEIREHLSASVAVGGHLYTIFYNSTHIRIKSTDRDYRSCTFHADSLSKNRLQAAVLGNERRFVIWSINRSVTYSKTIEVQSTMYLIDAWRCSYRNVPLANDYQPRWYRRVNLAEVDYPHEARVITYSDSFDVFFAGPSICSPCRYNVDGDEIRMRHQIEPDGYDAMEASYVKAANLGNGTLGYFQVCRFANFTAEIKLLDDNFKLLRQTNFRHVVSLIDVDQGEEAAIVLCYLSRYPKQPHGAGADLKYVYCKRYNSELDRVFSVRLPMAVDIYPSGFSLTLDQHGRTFVTYEAPYGNSTRLAVFQYDREGNLTRSLDFSDTNATRKIALGGVLTSLDYCLISLLRRSDRGACNKIIECIAV